ncbi:hypothetical protein [Methanopyrus sp.]
MDAAILTVTVLSLCKGVDNQAEALANHLPPFQLSSPYPTPFHYVLVRPDRIEVHPSMDPEGELRVEILPSGLKLLFDSYRYGARTVLRYRGPYLMITRLGPVGIPKPDSAVFFSDGSGNYALACYWDAATGRSYISLYEILLDAHELVRKPVPLSLDLGERLTEFKLYDDGTFLAKFDAGIGELIVHGSLKPPRLSVEWEREKGELWGETRPFHIPLRTSWTLLNQCPVVIFGPGTNNLVWPDRGFLVWRFLAKQRGLDRIVERIVDWLPKFLEVAIPCAYSVAMGAVVDTLSRVVRLPQVWRGPWSWIGALIETALGIPVLEWEVILPAVASVAEDFAGLIEDAVPGVDKVKIASRVIDLTIGWYEGWLRRVVMRTCGLSWWEVGLLWGVLDALSNLDELSTLDDLAWYLTFHLAASVSPALEVALYADDGTIGCFSAVVAALVRWPAQSLPF